MKKNNKKKNKGFSLVELVIVVAIMAILVGILAPQYIKYVERSRKSADASNVENFATAIKVGAADSENNTTAKTLLGKGWTLIFSTTDVEIVGAAGATGTDIVAGGITDLDNIFAAAMGDKWKSTKLKSSKWNPAKINMTVMISKEGSVTITYNQDVAEFL